ncbi:MAG: EpsG family protein [Ruminococcaceae bacterium]|nr:EpsG family protein [Oscillospiraceae bacterium]
MIVWIGMFVFIVGVKALMQDLDTQKKRKTYLIIVGLALALLFALRGENYGGVYDLRVYMDFFEETATTAWGDLFADSDFEVGFVVLNKLLSLLSHNRRTIIVFHAFFCIYSVCRFIYKNTDEVFWAFLFFFSLGNMGFFLTGLRQAIAICVCLFAVEKAKKKKLISFALVTLIAYSIHRSALVFAVMYLLLKMDLFKRNKKMIILPIILMMIFSSQIIGFGQMLSDEVLAAETATFSFNGIVPILIYALTIIGQIILVKTKKQSEKDPPTEHKDPYIGFSMTAMGLGLYFLRFYNMALERISFYFLQGAPVGLADVVGYLKHERIGRVFELIIIVLCFLLFWHRLDGASYADYVFFWRKQI